jgi:hypothetical protein
MQLEASDRGKQEIEPYTRTIFNLLAISEGFITIPARFQVGYF